MQTAKMISKKSSGYITDTNDNLSDLIFCCSVLLKSNSVYGFVKTQLKKMVNVTLPYMNYTMPTTHSVVNTTGPRYFIARPVPRSATISGIHLIFRSHVIWNMVDGT